jgi:hypothetical protein
MDDDYKLIYNKKKTTTVKCNFVDDDDDDKFDPVLGNFANLSPGNILDNAL